MQSESAQMTASTCVRRELHEIMRVDVVNTDNQKVRALELTDESSATASRKHLIYESVVHANARRAAARTR